MPVPAIDIDDNRSPAVYPDGGGIGLRVKAVEDRTSFDAAQDLPPALYLVTDAVGAVQRRTRRPANTTAICAELRFRIPESTVRYYCRLAEQHRLLYRESERGGWLTGCAAQRWTPPPPQKQWWDRLWWKRTRQLPLPFFFEVARPVEKTKPPRMTRTVDRSWIQIPLWPDSTMFLAA
jgi:hypothetical protein